MSPVKSFVARSSATRAAKQAGFTLDQVNINEVDGRFFWAVKPVADENTDAEVEVAVEEIVAMIIPPADQSLEAAIEAGKADVTPRQAIEAVHVALAADDFAQITEEAHATHRAEKKDHSTAERPCKKVWIIADDMMAADPSVKRKAILEACVAAGVAFFTARTQYQQWLGVRKEMAARETATS